MHPPEQKDVESPLRLGYNGGIKKRIRKGKNRMQLKHIPMDGPQNFRDLGGFLNQDGKMVLWNRLYRADSLAELTEKDASALRVRKVCTIVDLRGSAERQAMPDRVPEGIRYIACPLMREDPSAPDMAALDSFAQSLKIGYLRMVQENTDLVAQAVRAVMDGLERGAVVFHCTAGKDRTGVLAAILLLLLGVADEDIIADYQVSFTYNVRGINRLVAEQPELRQYLEQAGSNSMLHSDPANIQAVLALLNRENIAPWLEAAGVSREMQRHFREAMLVD